VEYYSGRVRNNQADMCITAAGHVVAAREGFRDAGPVNREPTARPQVAAGIPALCGGGGCQSGHPFVGWRAKATAMGCAVSLGHASPLPAWPS